MDSKDVRTYERDRQRSRKPVRITILTYFL